MPSVHIPPSSAAPNTRTLSGRNIVQLIRIIHEGHVINWDGASDAFRFSLALALDFIGEYAAAFAFFLLALDSTAFLLFFLFLAAIPTFFLCRRDFRVRALYRTCYTCIILFEGAG